MSAKWLIGSALFIILVAGAYWYSQRTVGVEYYTYCWGPYEYCSTWKPDICEGQSIENQNRVPDGPDRICYGELVTTEITPTVVSADGKGSYNFGFSEISDVVPEGLTQVDEHFSKDERNIYIIFDSIRSAKIEKPSIDAATFTLIPLNYGYTDHFYKDKNNVYVWNMAFSGAVVGLYKVIGADPSSFVLIQGDLPRLDESNNTIKYHDPITGEFITYSLSL